MHAWVVKLFSAMSSACEQFFSLVRNVQGFTARYCCCSPFSGWFWGTLEVCAQWCILYPSDPLQWSHIQYSKEYCKEFCSNDTFSFSLVFPIIWTKAEGMCPCAFILLSIVLSLSRKELSFQSRFVLKRPRMFSLTISSQV